ncbi:MAG: MmgE/PrpD family protein [Betaproteobacteria bacterium]|jgi:2-methylcitrate dehydratase PrpD
MPSLSEPFVLKTLAQASAALYTQTLPAEILWRAKQRVLDTLGCLVAGYEAGISSQIRDYVLSQGGKAESTLLPNGEKTTTALVALAHATYIFGLELADAAPRGTVHPGCEIVSVAMALAERQGSSGLALLAAIVAGYEVEIRFGRALHPHAFYKGWSTIGLLGAIGPAVTSAMLLKQDSDGIERTLGSVLSLLPAATGRVSQAGSVKWLVGGHACATGLMAAEMAGRGTQGSAQALNIWLPVISEKNAPERLTEGIDANGHFTQWELLSGVLTKYYATVGPIAAPLDAVFSLMKTHPIKAQDIKAIRINCTKRTAIFNNPAPDSDHTARASLPYCVAVAICTQDPAQLLGPAYEPSRLQDPTLLRMAQRVLISENEDYENQYPAHSLCNVSIQLQDDCEFSIEVDRTQNPRYLKPSDEDIEAKFRLIATPSLGTEKTERIIQLVKNLDALDNVQSIMEALRPER